MQQARILFRNRIIALFKNIYISEVLQNLRTAAKVQHVFFFKYNNIGKVMQNKTLARIFFLLRQYAKDISEH